MSVCVEYEVCVCGGPHSWLIPSMLSPPESLLISCIRRGNYAEAHQVPFSAHQHSVKHNCRKYVDLCSTNTQCVFVGDADVRARERIMLWGAPLHGAVPRSSVWTGSGRAEDWEPVSFFIIIFLWESRVTRCSGTWTESPGQQQQNHSAEHRKCSSSRYMCERIRNRIWVYDLTLLASNLLTLSFRYGVLLHLRCGWSPPELSLSPFGLSGGKLLALSPSLRPLRPPTPPAGGTQSSQHGCLWPGLLPVPAVEELKAGFGDGWTKIKRLTGEPRCVRCLHGFVFVLFGLLRKDNRVFFRKKAHKPHLLYKDAYRPHPLY